MQVWKCTAKQTIGGDRRQQRRADFLGKATAYGCLFGKYIFVHHEAEKSAPNGEYVYGDLDEVSLDLSIVKATSKGRKKKEKKI